LINVTAGLDLRTSEFAIVGDTVKRYASEDANVVVGCVIDPEMSEDLRVTVVATGIGRQVMQVQAPEMDSRRPVAMEGGRSTRAAMPPLQDLSIPTYIRNQREQQASAPSNQRRAVGDGMSYSDESMLDIPAFLRRQAD
jgi:cell division protein FtsZ